MQSASAPSQLSYLDLAGLSVQRGENVKSDSALRQVLSTAGILQGVERIDSDSIKNPLSRVWEFLSTIDDKEIKKLILDSMSRELERIEAENAEASIIEEIAHVVIYKLSEASSDHILAFLDRILSSQKLSVSTRRQLFSELTISAVLNEVWHILAALASLKIEGLFDFESVKENKFAKAKLNTFTGRRISYRAETLFAENIYIAAIKYATEVSQWNLVKNIIHNMKESSIKDQCCLRAVDQALAESEWEIISFLMHNIHGSDALDSAVEKIALKIAFEKNTKKALILHSELVSRSSNKVKAAIIAAAFRSATLYGRNDLMDQLSYRHEPDFTTWRAMNTIASVLSSGVATFSAEYAAAYPHKVTEVLFNCIRNGHITLAASLLPYSQPIDWQDSSGVSTLMLAADFGHCDLIESILQLGALVDLQDREGRSALSRACIAGQVKVAKTLLQAGAQLQHRDAAGLSCIQLATQAGQQDVIDLINYYEYCQAPHEDSVEEVQMRLAADKRQWTDPFRSDPIEDDKALSRVLHQEMVKAGFEESRVKIHHDFANELETMARDVAQDNRQMTGSFAEGWANNLQQVNGRVAADSDIDWTVMLSKDIFHIEGGCQCIEVTKLKVVDGHAQLDVPTGSQPAVSVAPCGERPAQDTCYAYKCCSSFCEDRVRLLLPSEQLPDAEVTRVHLVRATRPNCTNELSEL